VTLIEIGQRVGWVGGMLFLFEYIERKIITSRWYMLWSMERAQKRWEQQGRPQTTPTAVMPAAHTFRCTVCGKDVNTIFGCDHPDAPKPERYPVGVSPMPPRKDPP
jgi:hypothetical protein